MSIAESYYVTYISYGSYATLEVVLVRVVAVHNVQRRTIREEKVSNGTALRVLSTQYMRGEITRPDNKLDEIHLRTQVPDCIQYNFVENELYF